MSGGYRVPMHPNAVTRRFVASLAVLLFSLLIACSDGRADRIEEARRFTGYNLWWLGKRFEDLPLSYTDGTTFFYGTCEPSGDGGCAAPVQVIQESLCSFAPLDFAPAGEEEDLRGGATFLPVREGQALIRTGTVAITLFGQDDATTRRMAARLESLNRDPATGAGEPMPAPVSCD